MVGVVVLGITVVVAGAVVEVDDVELATVDTGTVVVVGVAVDVGVAVVAGVVEAPVSIGEVGEGDSAAGATDADVASGEGGSGAAVAPTGAAVPSTPSIVTTATRPSREHVIPPSFTTRSGNVIALGQGLDCVLLARRDSSDHRHERLVQSKLAATIGAERPHLAEWLARGW